MNLLGNIVAAPRHIGGLRPQASRALGERLHLGRGGFGGGGRR
jgi:hypothetical protein